MIEKLRAILIGGKEGDRSWVGIRVQSTVQPEGPRDFNETWKHIYAQSCRLSGMVRTRDREGV